MSLDSLSKKYGFPPPDLIKIDVEGAELLVLSGAREILSANHPAIFLATHGAGIHLQCCKFLESLGYELQSINQKAVYETDEILALKKNQV